MTVYVALLRAVNVGGTGKLPMSELKAMCEAAGYTKVETYIASGNVVFTSKDSARKVQACLEAALAAFAGKPVSVLLRTATEIAAVLAANPFPKASPTFTVAIFLDAAPPADTLKGVTGQAGEEVRLGKREIYIHSPNGQGRSKLKIKAALAGTARNMNTVAKLAEMASAR